MSRDLLFISHANPADNDFTLWLASRLNACGYRVWADLKNLRAGQKHWREIEEKIRTNASRVLVVTSRFSKAAEGVENEINIAKGIEKELGLESFILQLRIDDLPFTQLPPVLNNRLVIDFSGDWGRGLTNLLSELTEQGVSPTNHASSEFRNFLTMKHLDPILPTAEPVFSTWLPLRPPTIIYAYDFRGRTSHIVDQLNSQRTPAYSHGDLVVTFAIPDTVEYLTNSERKPMFSGRLNTWVHEKTIAELFINRRDRRAAIAGLMNKAFESDLKNRGFNEYVMANELAFYLPTEQKQIIKQSYTDPLGRITKPITLVGESKRYGAFWHAAVSSRFSLSPFMHFSVRLHVAFTDNGTDVIASGDRAFRMRRRFCKSFYNDRWRRILFALITRVNNSGEWSISTGGEEPLLIKPPFRLRAPYTIESDHASDVRNELIDDEIIVCTDENYFEEDEIDEDV